LTVKIRYKLPHESESALISFPVKTASARQSGGESQDFRFASAVAGFGMLLRDSPYKGNAAFTNIISMARDAVGKDPSGYRKGFVELAQKAKAISDSQRK
jgi:Ca-activated chloride channel family protein